MALAGLSLVSEERGWEVNRKGKARCLGGHDHGQQRGQALQVSLRDPDPDQQTVLLPFVKMKKRRVREAKGLAKATPRVKARNSDSRLFLKSSSPCTMLFP